MGKRRSRGGNHNVQNNYYHQSNQRRPLFPVVRTIGFMMNRHVIFSDAEMGRRQGSKPDNFGKFKRRMCFSGIPCVVLSSQAVANTVLAADEACCNAFIDNLKTYLPQRIVRPIFTAMPDPNSEELTALKPFFDELDLLLQKNNDQVGRLSQYEMTTVAKEIGSLIKQDLRKALINKHGLTPHEDGKTRPDTPNSRNSDSFQENQEHDDVVVLDGSDDEDVVIVRNDSQAGTSYEPIKVSCNVENLRQTDLKRKHAVEKEIYERRKAALASQKNQKYSPGYEVSSDLFAQFGKLTTNKNGPPSIWSQSRESSSRQQFVEDVDSDSSREDEPGIKKRKIIAEEKDEKPNQLTLNVSNNDDLDASNDSENGEEISLIDEWNGEESEENVEEEVEEERSVEGEDEYLQEEEEEPVVILKNVEKKRKSISDDKEKIKEDFGVDVKRLYDGEESLEKLEQRNGWPKDYERCLIGVVYNESLARAVENTVCEISERSAELVDKLSKDTWLHYRKNTQSRSVYDTKMEVRGKLFDCIQQMFPAKCLAMHVTGSSINGCGSFNSDIDMCLCFPTQKVKGESFDDYGASRSESLKVLRRIEKFMRNPHPRSQIRNLINRCELINAKVPIIKVYMRHPYSELDIDINVNNIAGIYNSHMLHYYSLIDGRFVSMALLIKHWAIINGINDSMNGTLNSYSLILLVVHFLQCGVRPAVLPNLQHLFPDKFDCRLNLEKLNLFGDLVDHLPVRPPNTWSVGELLIGFFNYYANFNFSKTAISIRSGQAFDRSTLPRDTEFYQMFIEEPFDAINTARCVRRSPDLSRIKKAFKNAAVSFSDPNFDLKNIKVTV